MRRIDGNYNLADLDAIVARCLTVGVEISRGEAITLWRWISNQYAAGWLFVSPETLDYITEAEINDAARVGVLQDEDEGEDA